MVRRNLKRVWCRCYPDLSIEKVRVGGQTCWEVTMRTVVDLERLTRVMDITFWDGGGEGEDVEVWKWESGG